MPNFDLLKPLLINSDAVTETNKHPYILCNEDQQQATLQLLSSKTSGEALGVHIGFSVWFNLDLLSVMPVAYAIVLDIDPMVAAVYGKIQTALNSACNPLEFIDHFLKLFSEDDALLSYPKEYFKSCLDAELSKQHGFLSSSYAYNRVKNLYSEQRLFFGTADITNVEQMALLAQWCEVHNLSVSTIYLSNIPEWIKNNSFEYMDIFKKNIRPLINPKTIVIDAFYPTKLKEEFGPPQRTTVGQLPSFSIAVASKHPKNPHRGQRFFSDDGEFAADVASPSRKKMDFGEENDQAETPSPRARKRGRSVLAALTQSPSLKTVPSIFLLPPPSPQSPGRNTSKVIKRSPSR